MVTITDIENAIEGFTPNDMYMRYFTHAVKMFCGENYKMTFLTSTAKIVQNMEQIFHENYITRDVYYKEEDSRLEKNETVDSQIKTILSKLILRENIKTYNEATSTYSEMSIPEADFVEIKRAVLRKLRTRTKVEPDKVLSVKKFNAKTPEEKEKQCTALTKKGQPCKKNKAPNSEMCIKHTDDSSSSTPPPASKPKVTTRKLLVESEPEDNTDNDDDEEKSAVAASTTDHASDDEEEENDNERDVTENAKCEARNCKNDAKDGSKRCERHTVELKKKKSSPILDIVEGSAKKTKFPVAAATDEPPTSSDDSDDEMTKKYKRPFTSSRRKLL